jgi:hypothetical protein
MRNLTCEELRLISGGIQIGTGGQGGFAFGSIDGAAGSPGLGLGAPGGAGGAGGAGVIAQMLTVIAGAGGQGIIG